MVRLGHVIGAATRMALAALAVCLVAVMASGPAAASSARLWKLESHSGQVHLVKMGISPIALTEGDVFAIGDWIETGPDGRAVLRRGEETIVVAPNSRIGLPTDNTGPFATRILQTLGTILLTVEKKAQQHFEVQTPYLTAVVKGTTFTVGIQDGHSVVHVVEGLVEVKNLASGHSALVRPGQTGSVSRGGARDVQVQGGAKGAAAVEVAASKAPALGEKAAKAADLAAKAKDAASATAVRIEQALGPKTLDLLQSTDGLVRAKGRIPAQAVAGGLKSAELAGQTGVTNARAKGGEALALGQSAGATRGLSDPGGNGLALGKSAGTSLSTPASSVLVVNTGAGAGSSLGNGNGNGLAVSQDLKPNPALVLSNAGGNGKALAKGLSK